MLCVVYAMHRVNVQLCRKNQTSAFASIWSCYPFTGQCHLEKQDQIMANGSNIMYECTVLGSTLSVLGSTATQYTWSKCGPVKNLLWIIKNSYSSLYIKISIKYLYWNGLCGVSMLSCMISHHVTRKILHMYAMHMCRKLITEFIFEF